MNDGLVRVKQLRVSSILLRFVKICWVFGVFEFKSGFRK